MPGFLVALFAAISSNPKVLGALPVWALDLLQAICNVHAARAEDSAAVIQAKAASKIADNAQRAEALREASKRLSDEAGRS